MAFHKYVEAQRKNLDSALKFELFATTCPLMDKLYEVSVAAVPNNKSPVFGQFLLICHKSFLAAMLRPVFRTTVYDKCVSIF